MWLCIRSAGGVVVLDSFDIHVTPEVAQSVTSQDIHLAVTPPGCAFKLLPITPFCLKFKVSKSKLQLSGHNQQLISMSQSIWLIYTGMGKFSHNLQLYFQNNLVFSVIIAMTLLKLYIFVKEIKFCKFFASCHFFINPMVF
jgi:hypothetical protein